MPSRFIAEMKLHENAVKIDPRERLKALRAASALRVEQALAVEKTAQAAQRP
jgi:ATP-dependent DNA helicase Rep